MEKYTGYIIVNNNGKVEFAGRIENQIVGSIYSIEKFSEDEDAYRERYKQLTGDYPPKYEE